MSERNAKLLNDLARTAPRTALAVDRPMSGVAGLLDYRTQQVEALVEVSATLERERARLVEALRQSYALPFAPSNNGEQWDEGFKRGWDTALDQVFRMANDLLRELGETEHDERKYQDAITGADPRATAKLIDGLKRSQ